MIHTNPFRLIGDGTQVAYRVIANKPCVVGAIWGYNNTASDIYVQVFDRLLTTRHATIVATSKSVTTQEATTGLRSGMSVAGPGIPDGTTIDTVDGANALTLTSAATSSTPGLGALLLFETNTPANGDTPSRPAVKAFARSNYTIGFGEGVEMSACSVYPSSTENTLTAVAGTPFSVQGHIQGGSV